jgi:hypothetical protein
MRPLFAIAPLALAFAFLGPTTTEAASTGDSLVVRVWHMVFDHDNTTVSVKPGTNTAEASTQAH